MIGRPLLFKDKETLEKRIEDYFTTVPEEEWTITGLALALDTSRETLMNYENREDYFDAIKKAKDRVHYAYEKDLRKKGRSGDIFALKNFGWTDKQEIDHTTHGDKIEVNPEILALTHTLNEIYRDTSSRGDGEPSSALGSEA